MKMNKLLSKHILSIVVTIAIVSIGFLINHVRQISSDAVIESTYDELDQIGLQYQILLSSTLEGAADDLSILADFIVENDVEGENIVEYMNSQSLCANFYNLHYIDLEGNGISINGEHRDFSQNDSFLHAFENKLYVENPYISIETSEVVFNLAVPVIKNNSPTAVLYCEVSVNDFFETVIQNKDYEGDIFFVDSNLNMIFSTSSNHIEAVSIPEEDVTEMGIENVKEAQSNIQSNQSGGFYYDYFGIPKVMVYYPIELTNVAFAMNVHVESLSTEIIRATEYFETVGAVVYWTVVALIVYIAISQTRSHKSILKVAYYDSLTSLPNLTKLKKDMSDVLKNNKDKRYSVVKIDIENFKAINEMFGFEIGNRVLQSFKPIRETVPEPTLEIARVGIDEFILFSGNGFLDDMETRTHIYEAYYNQFIPELGDYNITFKYGRYHIPLGDTDVDEIINRLNLAHRVSKDNEGITIYDYDESFTKKLVKDAEITNKTKSAFENKEFKVFLQPKFGIAENKLIGAEALVRWIEDDGNMIFPNDFIPLFERNGSIIQLDKYIFNEVCMTIRKWLDDGLSAVPISINCSRLNLQDPNFVNEVVKIAKKYNVPHKYIEIELTESTTIETGLSVEQLFEDLNKEGFKVSIDDFGAGYSSLGMLKNLKVDTLKMDRSFFIGGKNTRRNEMLIESIVKMAHNLKMYVVAEGIETIEQIELLKSMNCDAVQGYFYDKPMPISSFEEKYKVVMSKNHDTEASKVPIVNRINDINYACSFVPSGMIVAKIDEYFTLDEANDYYFDMIGYAREEIRDIFENKAINLMTPESQNQALIYFNTQMNTNPDEQMILISKVKTKSGKINTYKISGKVALNEKGEPRLYASAIDISDYSKADMELQNERSFIARISNLTNSVFYDYNKKTNTIRFSKNFADKFNIPDTIENFIGSKIASEILPDCESILSDPNMLTHRIEGEFCIKAPNGDPIWYLYSCENIYDEVSNAHRVVGKMSEAFGHKLEMDLLEAKSKMDSSISVYDKNANGRYIKNYLRIANSNKDSGVLFVIKLENFDKLESTFDIDFAKDALKDVGSILKSMFRNSDIIGRLETKDFYIFVNNAVSSDFIEKKKHDLRLALSKSYEKDDIKLQVFAKVGISFFPDHGTDSKSLYEKALENLENPNNQENFELNT